jgi:hypothetical protein
MENDCRFSGQMVSLLPSIQVGVACLQQIQVLQKARELREP